MGGFAPPPPDDDDDIVKDHDVFEADKAQESETFSTAIVCLILMSQHVWFAISTTSDAAAAYEQVLQTNCENSTRKLLISRTPQAMEGFNILRQHGFMYCRNKADRNFVYSFLNTILLPRMQI